MRQIGECNKIGYSGYESDDDQQERDNFKLRRKMQRDQEAEEDMMLERFTGGIR